MAETLVLLRSLNYRSRALKSYCATASLESRDLGAAVCRAAVEGPLPWSEALARLPQRIVNIVEAVI